MLRDTRGKITDKDDRKALDYRRDQVRRAMLDAGMTGIMADRLFQRVLDLEALAFEIGVDHGTKLGTKS